MTNADVARMRGLVLEIPPRWNPAGITEDQRARRSLENHALRRWNLALHFSVGRVWYSERILPLKHVLVGTSEVAAQEVLHCASVRVNLTEIKKCADLSAVLGVAMPAL